MNSDERISEAMKLFPIMPFVYERDTRKAMAACSFAIVASSKAGKTTMLKYILSKVFPEDVRIVMTMSPCADIYSDLKKNCAFAPTYLPDIIKTCYLLNKHTNNHYQFLIVIDDVTGVKNDRQAVKLLALYRNSGMSAIICGQDLTMLSAVGRSNCNSILLGKLNSAGRVEGVVRDFCRFHFPKYLSLEEKCELYNKLTQNHTFLHINQLENTITRVRLTESQVC